MASDDLSGNLATYKLQLQQVEAALTSDPNNAELLKLRKDLKEVIDLTFDLISGKQSDSIEGSSSGIPIRKWKAGEKCQAVWSGDGQYYEATIDEITPDGQCTLIFEGYSATEVSLLSALKPATGAKKRKPETEDEDNKKVKKAEILKEREYKRKKAQKKAQRQKQIEEERETEKSKWQQFNAKAFSKSKKGQVKKSIFASPDNINGRVGVGTCGIGGKPMTEYQQQEKWKKHAM